MLSELRKSERHDLLRFHRRRVIMRGLTYQPDGATMAKGQQKKEKPKKKPKEGAIKTKTAYAQEMGRKK